MLLGAGLEAGAVNSTCKGRLLCSADTEGEVQRGTAHLHSFVIPEETECSQTLSHDRVTHRGPLLTCRMQKKRRSEENGR